MRASPASPAREQLEAWLRGASAAGPLAVAFSGGADSTALLVELARLRAVDERRAGETIFAFHVHHGLQPAADRFVAHVEGFCRELSARPHPNPLPHAREGVSVPVTLSVAHVDVPLPAGASVEAQAREARYAALSSLGRQHGVGTVLLAQHADDQVETMLIALSRGAGTAGLAAMAPEFERDGVRFARPLLGVSGAAIRHWLVEQGIPFVDDPSNADERFTRNRLRRRVLPAIADALPAFRETFARSARLVAQAQSLLDEVADEDAARIGEPPLIAAVQRLSRARQANVLRRWLRVHHATTPSEAQLVELLDVIAACITRGHGIDLRIGRGHVRRNGAHLRFDPLAEGHAQACPE